MTPHSFSQTALMLNLPWIVFALCLGPAADTNSMLGVGGMVVLEDGTQPPFGSFIEIDCGDGFKKAAETTPSGTFFFRIDPGNRTTEFLVNAERNYGREAVSDFITGQATYQNIASRCDIRAHLSGYRSGTISLPLDDAKKITDVGAIVLHSNSKNKKFDVDVSNFPPKKESKKKQPSREIK
jgi:hypothetical protein